MSEPVYFSKYHVVRPSRNDHFGTFILNPSERHEVASFINRQRTHGINRQVCNPLSYISKSNDFKCCDAVAIFGCHAV